MTLPAWMFRELIRFHQDGFHAVLSLRHVAGIDIVELSLR